MRRAKLSATIILLIFVAGCASNVPQSTSLRQVALGMSKGEVVNALGEPAVARGAIRNKYNQVIEVWEYTFALPSKDSTGQTAGKVALTVLTLGIGAATFRHDTKDYWLYFLDNTLVRWGEAGDWEREPERIYDFNFDPPPQLKAPQG